MSKTPESLHNTASNQSHEASAGMPTYAPPPLAMAGASDAGGGAMQLMSAEGGGHSNLSAIPAAPMQLAIDYHNLAERIHNAIDGWGTDEEAVYLALEAVAGNATAIAELKRVYQSKYGSGLVADIEGDFSGGELAHCMELLDTTVAPAASANPHEDAARAVRDAVEGMGTSEEGIFSALTPFNRNVSEITKVKTAYQNLYGEDMEARIRSEMSGTELAHALDLMGIQSTSNEAVMDELESMEGDEMTWVPSSPGRIDRGGGVIQDLGTNNFAQWALAATEAEAPAVAQVTTINCWEMVLLAAHNAGYLSWQRIHDTYTSFIPPAVMAKINDPDPAVSAVGVAEAGQFIDGLLYSLMTSGPATVFDVANPTTPNPNRGDIVFFDGAAHVAIATGNGDEIYTFWPPPNTAFTAGGTVDEVKKSTITELSDWMFTNMGGNRPHVTFYAPSW